MILVLTLLNLFFFQATAQKYPPTPDNLEYWSATDYTTFIDTFTHYIPWKPVNLLQRFTIQQLKGAILNFKDADIKQCNITGDYFIETKYDQCHMIWNLYYPKLNDQQWADACKPLILLMVLDKTLSE